MSKKAMDDEMKVRLSYEIDILKNLDHPNIMKLYEIFEDKQNIYLVSELCLGGELFDEIITRNFFNETDAVSIMQQLLSAICYCHQKKVAHRDLKPENVLLDTKKNDHIKVIDFGTSQVFESAEQMHQTYGTAYYIAPEVLKGDYNEKCDLWSIGVIMYILLSGSPPFNGDSDGEILKKVKDGKITFSSS